MSTITISPTAERGTENHGGIYLTFACLSVALPLSLLNPESGGVLIYLIYLAFCIQLVYLRGGVLDPFVIFCLGTFLYGFVPFIAESQNDELIDAFGFQGGQAIFAYAMHALVFAFLAMSLLPRSRRESRRPGSTLTNDYDRIARLAFVLSAILSTVLEGSYSVLHGTVVGGDFDYGQGFRERGAAGSGILLLSYPLAVASLGFVLTSSHRYRMYSYTIALAPFALLFFVHGERKYLVAPALMTVARFVRVRSVFSILFTFAAAGLGWIVFVYLGHLRLHEYALSEAFREDVINSFVNEFRDEIGGETVTLFGTASAAYAGFVKPLPYLGDYLLAWIYSVPQFLVGNGLFNSTGDRFAYTFSLERAYDGMGWGFSFWGEAYGVMGPAGIYIAAIGITFLFRMIRMKALEDGVKGPFGVWLLAGLYEGLWLTRSDFAHFSKAFLVNDFAVIFTMYAVSKYIFARSKAEGRSSHR